MSQDFPPQDPLAFIQSLWANAGIPFPAGTPDGDIQSLERKITELKAVEGWLQSNLALLQGSIRMLEMHKAGAQALQQSGMPSPQAAAELWLKTLQQYQQGFAASPDPKSGTK